MEISSEMFDVTTLDTTTAAQGKTFKQGHVEWSGTIEGFYDDGTTSTVSIFDPTDLGHTATVGGTATFTSGASHEYEGNVWLSNISIENDREDYIRYTANWVGNGVPTITTTTA